MVLLPTRYCYVGRARPLGTRLDAEFDLLTLFQVLEAFAANGGVMHKDIRASRPFDEAKPFGSVEPFDRSRDSSDI
jgi:hypothetical protein